MVSNETVRKLALSFPETDEHPHFHLKAFRVKKKIFATLDEEKSRLMVKLNLTDQSVFCTYD
ncbi:MAG: MmcQ/YjbR family DNA-binding protein, partial [Chitinophagaceae bacterium]